MATSLASQAATAAAAAATAANGNTAASAHGTVSPNCTASPSSDASPPPTAAAPTQAAPPAAGLAQLRAVPPTVDLAHQQSGSPSVDLAQLRSVLEAAVDEGVAGHGNDRTATALSAEIRQAQAAASGPAATPWDVLYAEEMHGVAEDVTRARNLIRDADKWAAQAVNMAKSASVVDPTAMAALVHEARAASVKLPVLVSLEERAAKVGRWALAVEAAIAKSGAAGARAEPSGGPSLEELLRLHAEGLRLRLVGELWETLASTVAAISRGLREVRTSLVYFSSPARSLDAVADLRGLGVALPVDGILRDIVTGLRTLQPQPPAPLGSCQGAGSCQGVPGSSDSVGASGAAGARARMPLPQHPQVRFPSKDAPDWKLQFELNAWATLVCNSSMPEKSEFLANQEAATSAGGADSRFASVRPPTISGTHAAPSEPHPSSRAESRADSACFVGLHGMPVRSVAGWRVRVYYDEGEFGVASYDGTTEAIDPIRGLKVHLDGYKSREHLTDEDEWEWDPKAGGVAGPWPIERTFGPALRGYLSGLGALADKLGHLPLSVEPPATPKHGKRAAANGRGDDRRPGPKKVARTAAAGKAGAASEAKGKREIRDGGAGPVADRPKKAAGKATAKPAPVGLVPGGEQPATPPDRTEGGGGKRRKR